MENSTPRDPAEFFPVRTPLFTTALVSRYLPQEWASRGTPPLHRARQGIKLCKSMVGLAGFKAETIRGFY